MEKVIILLESLAHNLEDVKDKLRILRERVEKIEEYVEMYSSVAKEEEGRKGSKDN